MATISSSRRLNDQSCDRTALLLEFDITVCIQMLVVHLFINYLFIFETDNFQYILLPYDKQLSIITHSGVVANI